MLHTVGHLFTRKVPKKPQTIIVLSGQELPGPQINLPLTPTNIPGPVLLRDDNELHGLDKLFPLEKPNPKNHIKIDRNEAVLLDDVNLIKEKETILRDRFPLG
jgi:hypothetical protein